MSGLSLRIGREHKAIIIGAVAVGFLIAGASSSAQEVRCGDGVPRDTSYTLFSAARKIYKKFPNVKLAADRLPAGVDARRNIVFASNGGRHLCLDVFKPAGDLRKKYPGVLIIHGGGWVSGDRSMLVPMAERITSHGYVTVTADYRLAPEALYPAGVYDVKAAVRWMRANGDEYQIDTTRIVAYGCSAGGELASFLGATNGLKKFEGEGGNQGSSSRVQAVVNVDGLLDFMSLNSTKYDNNPAKPSAAERWFGGSYRNIPGVWKDASPITYAGSSTPPTIFINSSMAHYHAGRDSMVAIMKRFGIYSEVRTLPGTPHTFWLFHPWFDKTLEYTLGFLDEVFRQQPMRKGKLGDSFSGGHSASAGRKVIVKKPMNIG